MPRPDDERSPRDASRQANEPAITRTVWIDDVRTQAAKPGGNADYFKGKFPPSKIHYFTGDAVRESALKNLAVLRRKQPDIVAASAEALQFCHDATLLSAPASGGFGVDDAPLVI